MTVPATGDRPVQTNCQHCTVPVDSGDVCSFCRSYEPPTELDGLLAAAHTQARQAAEDLSDALAAGDVPLLAAVDIVTARAHLIAAQRLIDAAATRITAAEVVAR